MVKKIAIIALGLVLGRVIIYAMLYASGKYYIAHNKDEIENLVITSLPASAYEQHEFSKEKIESYMRSCVTNAWKRDKDKEEELQKAVNYCGCLVDKRARGFTLIEYYTAGNAKWDPKLVPESVKKNTQMEVECEHSVYK